jgi:predicted transcriptional regulator
MLISGIDNKDNKLKYRSKPDIMAQILTATKDRPLGKTKVMYSVFLSSNQTKEYLRELLAKRLLSYNEVTRMYQTTSQGIEFLQLYEQMKNLGE